jgi:cell division protein FtsB
VGNLKIPFDSLFALIGLVLLSIFLIRNIYLNIDIWLTNYQLKGEKESQVQEIKAENDRLKKAVEYYKSNFYQRKYARESLNLAEPNQTLFLVERKREYDFLQEPEQQQMVEIESNRNLWIRLIL